MISPVLITGVILGLIAAGVLGESAGGAICPSIVVVFLVFFAVMFVSKFTAIRPAEITDDSITLAGVHDDFVDAYEELREARRAKRRADDYE
jgi:hypothetical protein